MRKAKIPVKILGWIICVIGAVILTASAAAFLQLESDRLYGKTEDEIKIALRNKIGEQYAMEIMSAVSDPDFDMQNMSYVLQRDELENLELEFEVAKYSTDEELNSILYGTDKFEGDIWRTDGFTGEGSQLVLGHDGDYFGYYTYDIIPAITSYPYNNSTSYYDEYGHLIEPEGRNIVLRYNVHDPLNVSNPGSLFVQADTVAHYLSVVGDMSAILIFVSIAMIFAGLIMGVWAAGDQIRFVNKIPAELYAVLCGCVILFSFFVMMSLFEASLDFRSFVFFEAALTVIASSALFFGLSNLATRIKAHSLFRYSFLYYIFRALTKGFGIMNENIPFMIGVGMAMVVLTIIQMGGLVFVMRDEDIGLFLFVIYKIIAFVVVFFVAHQFLKNEKGVERIVNGNFNEPIDTTHMYFEMKNHAENINRAREGIALAVAEQTKSERMRSELITNVSHDIKTPLTSIINYVDLLDKEDIKDPRAIEYIEVLKRQSERLKKLTEDLIEASKASTGNIEINCERINASVLLSQATGEFSEKMSAKELELVQDIPEEMYVNADGRYLWRVIDNLLGNICKYALPGTRVYVEMKEVGDKIDISFKNVSSAPLNITPEELTERFVRGDRSRNTEGSGLGLSIANSLTALMGGTLNLNIDGDLFKAVITFDKA